MFVVDDRFDTEIPRFYSFVMKILNKMFFMKMHYICCEVFLYLKEKLQPKSLLVLKRKKCVDILQFTKLGYHYTSIHGI